MSLKKWIIVDFDCYHGCNNPEFNPGCDESSIRIKIDADLSKEYDLFKKYMKIPCPRCGKVGEQKRSGWWEVSNNGKMKDYDGSFFTSAHVQDYTIEMMEAKIQEIDHSIEALKRERKAFEKKKELVTEWVEIHRN